MIPATGNNPGKIDLEEITVAWNYRKIPGITSPGTEGSEK
jgi:hypothetical protein